MIRTGDEYRASLQDGREVYMDGELIEDVSIHPQFKPLVDVRARIHDLQHDEMTQDIMTFEENVISDGQRVA